VDALTRSPRHFDMKVERAKTYFPFIEKIFAEERLPDDFKYLALQESALIPDAVSVSNAVGFWQFKDFTAMEMGMRVDKEIDERMNLVSASRGAAKYLKKNNNFFNNWLLALQSYQMGAGGVQRSVGDKHNGARHMEITSDTYWYVKKYLAHKVAFENAVKGDPQLKVIDYQPNGSTSLSDLAKMLSVEEAKLMEYNKWIRKGNIPDDRKYTLLIPVGNAKDDFTRLALSKGQNKTIEVKSVNQEEVFLVNGVPAIKAQPGELVTALAKRANLRISDFLRYNDVPIDHRVKSGAYYFIEKKKAKAAEPFHQLQQGEDLWTVSQRYGVQLKKLMKYNRANSHTKWIAGTQIWMSTRMPKDANALIPSGDALEVSEQDSFEWNTIAPTTLAQNKVTIQPLVEKALDSLEVAAQPEEKIEETERMHTVQQGETLYAIARNYAVSVNDLMQWNSLDLQKGIQPGQTLKVFTKEGSAPDILPKTVAAEESVQYHEVKNSDTLYSVARQYGVTIKELMDWNSKTDFSLSVGEKLKVSSR
jgi:membrane-bound lytic murein transglycosylase D